MWRPYSFLCLLLLAGCPSTLAKGKGKQPPLPPLKQPLPLNQIHLVDIYDNESYDSQFQSLWGFACVARVGKKTILFDTGGRGRTLMANLQRAKIQPREIDIIVLSHNHGDHTGGLKTFLKANPKVVVYVPSSLSGSLKRRIRKVGARLVVVKQPVQILPGVYSTGILGKSIKEQAMIIHSSKGMIVLTGCSHPGILKILARAKKLFKRDIYLVMGGFHLMSKPTFRIVGIIKKMEEMKVQKLAPSHCTGARAKALFKKHFGPRYIRSGVGKIVLK